MSILDAIDSQGYEEPAKVEAARPDLAAIAEVRRILASRDIGREIAALLKHMHWQENHHLQHHASEERLTKERDAARELCERIYLASTGFHLDERRGDQLTATYWAAVRSWRAETEVKP